MQTQTELLIPDRNTAAQNITPPPQNGNPFLMVIERCVLDPNFSVEKLQALLKVQQEWDAIQAKKAFDEAKAKFSTFAIKVTRDKENKQYDSRYTSLGNLVNTVTPYLAQCDLHARWEPDQTDGIRMTCILRHKMGHEERAMMKVPIDTSGAKNPIQQIKSSMTYARNCTFEMVCGLASSSGPVNLDDDGNGAGTKEAVPEEMFVARLDAITNSGNLKELQSMYRAAYEEAEKIKDQSAQDAYIKAKNQRYRELAAK